MLLNNFWYVLAEAADVRSSPLKVRALGQDLVLFRRSSDGQVTVLSDVCVHRRASLAGGTVEGDCLRCPYHGWAFAPDGTCTHIPANPAGVPIPARARVPRYPVEERYGWIWAFLGDLPPEERPRIPAFPELEEPGWRAVRGTFTWQAPYTRVVENAVDVAHTPFLHRRSFGNPDNPVMPPFEVTVKPHSVETSVVLESPRPRGFSRWVMGAASTHTVHVAVHLPNLTVLETTFAGGWRFRLLLSHLPVDDRTTLTRYIQLRTFLRNPLTDGFARAFTRSIMLEDRPTVEAQHPTPHPWHAGDEVSVRSDALTLAYRKLLGRFGASGGPVEEAGVPPAPRVDTSPRTAGLDATAGI
jgi:phenylpropionate dioxygenase-like ring-hydroxylating dioxygenase large terminal subunit